MPLQDRPCPQGWNLDLNQGESRSLGVSSGAALLAGGEGAHESGPHKSPHGLRFCPRVFSPDPDNLASSEPANMDSLYSSDLFQWAALKSFPAPSLGLGLHTTSSRQGDSLLQTLLLEPLLLSLSTNGVTGNAYFQLGPSPSLHFRQLLSYH